MARLTRWLSLIALAGVCVVLLLPQRIVDAQGYPIFPPSPNPCTSIGQTHCQPVWGGPSAAPTPTPTPGPITANPTAFSFAYPGAASQNGAISDPYNSTTLTASSGNTQIATVTITAGTTAATVTITPTGAGSTTITVTDATLSTSIPVTVGTPTPTPTPAPTPTPTPTPGPITANPTSFSFAYPNAANQNGVISDPGNTVTLTASSGNTSIATVTITAGTTSAMIAVTPVGAGSTTITVSDTTLSTAIPVTVGTATPAPAPSSICVAGNVYNATQYDDFTSDSTLSASDNGPQPLATPPLFSTQFAFGQRYNNQGTDDAYYEPLTYTPSVFSIGGGAPLGITASHLSTPTNPPVSMPSPLHWASGTLSTAPFTYGYVEWQAEVPNLQGFWPALWLVPQNGTTGNYVNGGVNPEYDAMELFGNALGAGVIQQTDIQQYATQTLPQIQTYNRTTVASAGTNYHTYGVLWTSTGVTFYIDRVPQTWPYANYTNGPMSAQITLQVFGSNAFAPAPASTGSQTMYVNYYRLYQKSATTCGTNTLPTPLPTPGPLTVNPTSFTFGNPGSVAQNGAINDPNNTQPITATSNNTSVATVTVTAGTDNTSATVTVTPVGPGSTSVTISDGTLSTSPPISVGTYGPATTPTPFPQAYEAQAPAYMINPGPTPPGSATMTATLAQQPVNGDLLVLEYNGTGAAQTPGGTISNWTTIYSAGFGSGAGRIYAKCASSNEGTTATMVNGSATNTTSMGVLIDLKNTNECTGSNTTPLPTPMPIATAPVFNNTNKQIAMASLTSVPLGAYVMMGFRLGSLQGNYAPQGVAYPPYSWATGQINGTTSYPGETVQSIYQNPATILADFGWIHGVYQSAASSDNPITFLSQMNLNSGSISAPIVGVVVAPTATKVPSSPLPAPTAVTAVSANSFLYKWGVNTHLSYQDNGGGAFFNYANVPAPNGNAIAVGANTSSGGYNILQDGVFHHIRDGLGGETKMANGASLCGVYQIITGATPAPGASKPTQYVDIETGTHNTDGNGYSPSGSLTAAQVQWNTEYNCFSGNGKNPAALYAWEGGPNENNAPGDGTYGSSTSISGNTGSTSAPHPSSTTSSIVVALSLPLAGVTPSAANCLITAQCTSSTWAEYMATLQRAAYQGRANGAFPAAVHILAGPVIGNFDNNDFAIFGNTLLCPTNPTAIVPGTSSNPLSPPGNGQLCTTNGGARLGTYTEGGNIHGYGFNSGGQGNPDYLTVGGISGLRGTMIATQLYTGTANNGQNGATPQPVYITEQGTVNSPLYDVSQPNASYVDVQTQAKYTARDFMQLQLDDSAAVVNTSLARASNSYIYDLAMENNGDYFAMFDWFLNPMPAYTALRSYSSIMTDTLDAFPSTYSPSPISYYIDGTADVRSFPVGKKDGSYDIAIWRADGSMENGINNATPLPIPVPTPATNVRFGTSHTTYIAWYVNPTTGQASPVPLSTNAGIIQNEITINIPDMPMILEVDPGSEGTPSPPTPQPIVCPYTFGPPVTPAPSATSAFAPFCTATPPAGWTPPPATPTPVYTNPAPYGTNTPTGALGGPVGPFTLPTPGKFTIMAQIKCNPGTAQATNGSTIFSLGSEITLKAGQCAGSTVSNPVNVPASTQVYLLQTNVYSEPANQLDPTPTQFVIVATDDGSANLTYYVCTYPTVSCAASTAGAVSANATYTSTTAYIGSEVDGVTRPFQGDIWNVQLFNSVIATTASAMASAVAQLATPDPYPSPVPLPTPVYTNPTPAGMATSGTYPWPAPTVAGVPTPNVFTWIAQINCQPQAAQLANGSAIMTMGDTSVYAVMKAGTCNGTQGASSTTAQGYLTTGAVAQPATGLSANTSYIIALTDSGAAGSLVYYVCPFTSPISCTATTGSIGEDITFASSNLFIGAQANNVTRPFSGDIWNINIYNSVLASTASAMASVVSAIATADPYPTPTQNANPSFPAAGWVPYTSGGPLQQTVASQYGTNNQILGNGANCAFTSSLYGPIQKTVTSGGNTYTTCLHINTVNVPSQLASDLSTSCSTGNCNSYNAMAKVRTDVGTQSYFASTWNTGTHAGYEQGPNSGGAIGAFYVAPVGSSATTATMGVYSAGCGGNYSVNGAGVSYPMASTNGDAVHYSPLWVPQEGPDAHMFIRDYNTGLEWSTIISGIPNNAGGVSGSDVMTANGQYWPSNYAPYTQPNGTYNAPPGSGCSGTYAAPGTVSNYSYISGTYSHGIDLGATAGGMSMAYSLRPEEVRACESNPTASCINHALTFTNYCDTYSGSNAYVNYPAYGGDSINSNTQCPNQTNFVDYGGLLWSDSMPTQTPTSNPSTCNWLEWFLWATANQYGWYKNDVTGTNFLGYQTYAMGINTMADSVDTWNAPNTLAGWKAASQWYALATDMGQTITENSIYNPTVRNPSCGLSMATNLHYLVPPPRFAGGPTWSGFTIR